MVAGGIKPGDSKVREQVMKAVEKQEKRERKGRQRRQEMLDSLVPAKVREGTKRRVCAETFGNGEGKEGIKSENSKMHVPIKYRGKSANILSKIYEKPQTDISFSEN